MGINLSPTSWVSEEDWCKGSSEGACVWIGGKEEIFILMKMSFVPPGL